MHPLRNGSQTTVRPANKPLVGSPGYFTESGDNNAPSYPGADWFNHVIDEFQNALLEMGITFNPENDEHLKLAFTLLKGYINNVEDNQQKSPSASLFSNAFGFTSLTNNIALLKNRAGSNQDTWVMLFGDSHAWGQGAPESDRFQNSSNFSKWSAAQYNQGFMSRVVQYLNDNKKWSVNKYGAGMTASQKFLHSENNIKVNTGDPECSYPLVCLGGNIESKIGDFVQTANTPLSWYAPQVYSDTYSNVSYREKLSAGLFGNSYLRLKRCSDKDMPTNGKEQFWEITANYSAVTFGSGFKDLTYDSGESSPIVIGARNTTTNTVYLLSGTPVPDWIKVGAEVYIPGIGYSKVNVINGTNNSVGFTKKDGTPLGTNLSRQVYLGLKVYPAIYAYGLLMAEMQSPARALYIAIKRQPQGGKVRLAFTTNMNGGFLSIPTVDNNSTFRNSANSWAWKLASGIPAVQRVSNDGTLIAVPEAVSDAFGVVIDTEHSVIEDVVYRVDWGSRQQGRLFLYLDQTTVNDFIDTRGLVFDNNKVVNFAMGAHTVGAWIGTQDTTAGDGIRDHVADILTYTPVKPSYVIAQIPFVNEYLMQTPVATFKNNLQIFVNKFLSHMPLSNNYNTLGTDFMFFTSLRNREVAFEGAVESAITYDMYVQAAKEFCADNGHAFVDCESELFRLVDAQRLDYQRLYNDSNHPSDLANEIIYKVLKQDYLDFIV